jgi:hypothetical protein
MGSLEKRIEALEYRWGMNEDPEARERRGQQVLEEFMERYEQKLRWVSPRVESGEVGLADMERESLAFAAALYITLRHLGDERSEEARELLEAKMADLERRFPEARAAIAITRHLIDFYSPENPPVKEVRPDHYE